MKIITIIYIIICIMLIPAFVKSSYYIIDGNIKGLRNAYLLGSSSYMGRWLFYFFNYIARPFMGTLGILSAYCIATNQKEYKLLFFLSALGVVIHYIVAAGRSQTFYLLLYIVIASLINKRKGFFYWRNGVLGIYNNLVVKGMFFLVPIIIAGLVYMTSKRLHFGLGVMGIFCLYLIGPLSYLDIIVSNFNLFGISAGKLLYGKATWGFVTGPIDTVVTLFVTHDYNGADYILGLYDAKYYNVGNGIRLNSASTIIYTFLKDYGIAGIILGTAQFSLICTIVFFWSRNGKKKAMWGCFLIYIFYTIVFSFWRYQLLYTDSYMTLIWIFIFFVLNMAHEEKANG